MNPTLTKRELEACPSFDFDSHIIAFPIKIFQIPNASVVVSSIQPISRNEILMQSQCMESAEHRIVGAYQELGLRINSYVMALFS
jgi:hypothetical protein